MRIPVTAEQFLAEYWQRRPLFMPTAIDALEPVLTADELAWLAIQEDVESRLVFTERRSDGTRYRLENGPFSEAQLNALPDRDWTLLVQDVEKHLPEFRAILRHVDFIPDWRIDDLMISFAAPGGSVGPHRDHYDVFLCQATGHRQWMLGDPAKVEADRRSKSLSLLLPYEVSESWSAGPGDVLYLPPGLPHWGVAEDCCMTFSIGMRAPTQAELHAGAARLFGGDATQPEPASARQNFYRDPDLQPGEAEAGRISPHTVRRLRHQGLLDDRFDDEQVASVFGAVVTDPKAWLMPDLPDSDTARRYFEATPEFRVHGMARIAWYQDDERSLLFVNGNVSRMPLPAVAWVRELCERRIVAGSRLRELLTVEGGCELLAWMAGEGMFDVAPEAG